MGPAPGRAAVARERPHCLGHTHAERPQFEALARYLWDGLLLGAASSLLAARGCSELDRWLCVRLCRGDGRTEAVQVEYDPRKVSYEQLLRTFWQEHDASIVVPGKEDQYRSVIWAHDEQQQRIAEMTVREAKEQYETTGRDTPATVVVRIDDSTPGRIFIPAETYHQNFWAKTRAKFFGLAVVQLLLVLGTQSSPQLSSLLGTAVFVQQAIIFWWFLESAELVFSAARGMLAKE
eukprot:scaffold319078_cov37-Tisochrysis_lutea.AAC.1